jgi:parvulin-like peptidyl-prolyl isomerase
MRLLRFLPLSMLLVAGLLAAGCGGGTKAVPANAVAVVGDSTILKADFNKVLTATKKIDKIRKTATPKPGTTEYKTRSDGIVQFLVTMSELTQKAKSMGLADVTDKEVQTQIDQIKKQYANGDEKKFETLLAGQGLTIDIYRLQWRYQLLSNRISAEVTKGVKVTDADVKKYYDANKANYTQVASRDVRHILVNSKKLADTIEAQLKAGGNFAKLAKKYSKDTGSAVNGGKLTIQKGKTVPEFDKTAFALKTNEISAPVHTTYGWHIIQALSAVKPAQTKPLKDEEATIRQQLVSTKKQDAMTKWLDDMKKSYSKSLRYQAGYTPTATTTTAASTTAPTTTG